MRACFSLSSQSIHGFVVDYRQQKRLQAASAWIETVSVAPERDEGFLHRILCRSVITDDPKRQAESSVAEGIVNPLHRTGFPVPERRQQIIRIRLNAFDRQAFALFLAPEISCPQD